jgi:hypothetical protein
MQYRIACWAVVGLPVVVGWNAYILATFPEQITAQPLLWVLVKLTCPIAFASFYFHFGVGIYWVLLANAATYALLGLMLETLRKRLRHAA